MRWIILIIYFPTTLLAAGTRIGSEALLSVPSSAYYSLTPYTQPGDGETVSNNPPIFSWSYVTNNLDGGEQNPNGFYPFWSTQTNDFNFQIATNSGFTGTLAVDVHTPVNFYNTLAPLPTNVSRTLYWRAIILTNSTAYWTNGPFSFTITATASNWDRSMLIDTNYLATNLVHPSFLYRSNEEAAIFTWITTTNPVEYAIITNRATFITNQSYWTSTQQWLTNSGSLNPVFTTVNQSDYQTRVNDLGAILCLWRFSGDNRWTNASMTGWLCTNLAKYVNFYNHPSNNWAMADYGFPAGSPEMPRLLCATYDWMYWFLGNDVSSFNGQLRSNTLVALKQTCRFWTYNNFWQAWPYPTGQLQYNYDWFYQYYTNTASSFTNLFSVGAANVQKVNTSHTMTDMSIIMPVAFIIAADDPEGAFAFDWIANFLFARTTSFAGWAAHHIGPYGYVDNTMYSRELTGNSQIFDLLFPQSQLWRSDFWKRFPEWWSRLEPFNMRKYHGPYGDGSPSGLTGAVLGDAQRGLDIATMGRSGIMRQAWDLNRQYSNTFADATAQWDVLPLRYHYRTLPDSVTNSTSMVYPEDGYVIASSKSPSEFDCYTNGVGWSMRASPRPAHQGHNIPADGSLDLWAYGAQLTDSGGAGLDTYSSVASGNIGLFVNGYGQQDYGFSSYLYSQNLPVFASISAYTNSGTNFVYALAELTGVFTNSYHPLSNLVTKARRHVLFPRSKYWVIYDEFSSTSNATFAFRWQVPWCYRYESSGSALANETAFSGDRFGSNSFSLSATGFTYTAGNYADSSYANPPRVPVHVFFATTGQGVFVATGTNSLFASTANVIGTSATNSTLNPFQNKTWDTVNPDRAAGLWVTNTTAATNWHFLTVVVPQQSGVAAPTFLAIDDQTVAVTYDGVTETNTWNTNLTSYSYQVALSASVPNPPPPPSAVTVARAGGKTKMAGKARIQ